MMGVEKTKEVNINTPRYWNRLWGSHGGGERDDLERLMPIVDMTLEGSVLDVGCGLGHLCHHLWEYGCNPVYGVDISREGLKHAKRNYPKCEFVCASGEKLPFRDGLFQSVCMAELLEHVSDYEAVLKEAVRVGKEGGVVVVTVPNGSVYTEHVWTFWGAEALRQALGRFNSKCGAEVLAGKWLLGWFKIDK